jgi:uncharacterized SAM-binding protein YcdF (DUF218 family)
MKKVKTFIRAFLIMMGLFFTLMILMAFTSAPFWIWYNLGVKKAGIHRPPDFIVVMGGGGMPSESGLMRCWYASEVANHFTRARIIIALPGDVKDSLSSVNQMKREMELRGIAGDRIFLEDSGTNTRAEALNILKIITNNDMSRVTRHASLLIVTSPEHLYRAVLTFKKAGFMKVDGVPAFEKTIEADLNFNAGKLGARSWVPDVGRNITLRYEFWVHMEYEFLLLREYLALAYYKLQGWV